MRQKFPLHEELYSYYTDPIGWKNRFLTPELLSKNWDLYANEELPNIYTIPTFTEEFCDFIMEEAESCDCWTIEKLGRCL